jgi:drug/metabolite transporter (DMT)-like permease
MLLGAILMVCSAVVYDGAVVLLAVAARGEAEGRGGSPLATARRPPALLAQGLNLAAWGLEVLGLTRLPLTLARVLGAVGQVVLLAFARLVLAEPVGRREVAGALAVCAGIVAVGVAPPSAGHPEPAIRWLPVLTVLGPPALGPAVRRRQGRPVRSTVAAVGAGIAYALSGLFTKQLADELSTHRPLPLLLALAGTALFGLVGSLNEIEALAKGRATAVAPIGAALQLVLPIACAPVLFGETWPSGNLARGMTAIGVVLATAGAATLAGVTSEEIAAPASNPEGHG